MRTMTLGSVPGRDEFGTFLTERKLTGRAAEVGTHRGDFAKTLLSTWRGTLTCIDPWSIPEGYESQAKTLWGGGTREDDFNEAQKNLSPFGERYALLRTTSEKAVRNFSDNSLDFVYLDGDHRYSAVSQDLSIWWPKIKKGGILAGHDLVMPGEVNGGWEIEIQPAVFEFAWSMKKIIYLVPEHGLPWSYYFEK